MEIAQNQNAPGLSRPPGLSQESDDEPCFQPLYAIPQANLVEKTKNETEVDNSKCQIFVTGLEYGKDENKVKGDFEFEGITP